MSTADFQNVLEMRFYDDDTAARDDLLSVIMFDISQLRLGQKEIKMFTTNTEVKLSHLHLDMFHANENMLYSIIMFLCFHIQTHDKLWVEFELEVR